MIGKHMNEYTFKMTFELAETVKADTLMAARDSLIYNETHWLVERPNGDIISTVPRVAFVPEGKDES